MFSLLMAEMKFFKCKLNDDEAASMIQEITNDEIKKAMFDIDDGKAPGPDGFSSTFFKKNLGNYRS